jgi:hypothetical protein
MADFMRREQLYCFWAAGIMGVMLLGAGCDGGPAQGRVTGIVTLGGMPLRNAEVVFYPDNNGRASAGVTDTNGRYELMVKYGVKGVVPGSHAVTISTQRPASDELGASMLPERVPEKYRIAGALTAEVRPGMNTIDWNLTE